MRFFRWVGVHPISVVLVVAATIAVMLVLSAGDDPAPGALNPGTTVSPLPSATGPGRPISEPGLEGWKHTGAGRFEATGTGDDVEYTSRGGPGVLWLDDEVGDFELTLEFKIEKPSGDSGVFVRLQDPEDASTLDDPLEIQISSKGPGEESTGAVFGVEDPVVFFTPQLGHWHEMNVRAIGMRVFVSFDGIAVTQFPTTTDPNALDWGTTGYIGLQNHSADDVVRFRNIRLSDL